jgi:hypothetical protein
LLILNNHIGFYFPSAERQVAASKAMPARVRPRATIVRILSVNAVETEANGDKGGQGSFSLLWCFAVSRCPLCRPETGYEAEGREFESLRAHHFSFFAFVNVLCFASLRNFAGSGCVPAAYLSANLEISPVVPLLFCR